MKIDRMFFERFEDVVRVNDFIAATVAAGQWDRVIDYINKEVFDKPEEYYSLDKLRKAAAVDRRLTLREILEKVFGLIPRFKSKDELLEEEFAKFVANAQPNDEEAVAIPAIKAYFKAYITSGGLRDIIESRHYTELATNPLFSARDFQGRPDEIPPPCSRIRERLRASQRVCSVGGTYEQRKQGDHRSTRNGNYNYFHIRK